MRADTYLQKCRRSYLKSASITIALLAHQILGVAAVAKLPSRMVGIARAQG